MNSFVTFSLGQTQQKSPILNNSGKTPNWGNCSFDFVVKNIDEKIRMEVWGKNIFKDKSVGHVELAAKELIAGLDSWF